jgi:hypothetical protein
MTRGVGRHINPDTVGLRSLRSRILTIQLLLATCAILVQLTLPVACTWHIHNDHSNQLSAISLLPPVAGFRTDTDEHASFETPAQPHNTHYDSVICGVCQSLFQVQYAIYAQLWVTAATAMQRGLIYSIPRTSYALLHDLPTPRAPPLFIS